VRISNFEMRPNPKLQTPNSQMIIFIQLLVTLFILAVIAIYSLGESKKWYEKWPAISDDEFMSRCPCGTNRETALRIREIISEQTGVEYERIHPEQSFINDLDCC
jgi:hypothetical protein